VRGQSTLKPKILAFLWSIFGLVFVFIVVIEMNNEGWKQPEKKKESTAQFEIQKVSKPKPKPRPKPKPKPKKAKPKRATPTPNLSSQLSGLDTGLEAFQSEDFIDDNALLGDVGKDMVMTDDTVDQAPQPARRSPIEYPKKARKLGITGYVLMNLLINKQGRVEKVKVLESDPAGTFDDVAIAAVKTWEFKPAQYQGKAVKVWAKQKIRFDLN
jgi:protein TonB